MAYLSWVSDSDLETAVNKLLGATQRAKAAALEKIEENVIDPFSAIFQMSGFQMSYEEWFKSEEARQAQKTMQNFVGEFHQEILGYCYDWSNLGKGRIVDLVNRNSRIIAEVKNKHNTISGGDLAHLYWSLEGLVMDKFSVYKDYTAYHVTIIQSEPVRSNKEFTPSDKEKGKKCPNNELIRQIDGASFYELATGSPTALEDLYKVIPDVIANISGIVISFKSELTTLFRKAYG